MINVNMVKAEFLKPSWNLLWVLRIILYCDAQLQNESVQFLYIYWKKENVYTQLIYNNLNTHNPRLKKIVEKLKPRDVLEVKV